MSSRVPPAAPSSGRTVRRALNVLAEPVRHESRALLARNWSALPAHLRTSQQMLGVQGNGCGATIGAMPRCDFACRGCYLGEAANRIPAEPVEAIMRQMEVLRPILGPDGNLQITDGEVTLRPPEEVIALLQHAHSLELVPMLMTHGDSFRRRPGLLERFLTEGALVEVSIHVDTTQRGRLGAAYKGMQARKRRSIRCETSSWQLLTAAQVAHRKRLRAATTMTVTRDNIDGVQDVIRWLVGGQRVFRMISFQPIAQVGRTEDGFGGGVTCGCALVDASRSRSLVADAADADVLLRSQVWFGHPSCNRILHGLVAHRDGAGAALPCTPSSGRCTARRHGGCVLPPLRWRELQDRHAADGHRTCARHRRACAGLRDREAAGIRVALAASGLAPAHPVQALRDLLSGALRVQPLVIVSHHFMSADEIHTDEGQARLAQCVFHVPVNGELVSMCEVNALGVRDAYYAGLATSAG